MIASLRYVVSQLIKNSQVLVIFLFLETGTSKAPVWNIPSRSLIGRDSRSLLNTFPFNLDNDNAEEDLALSINSHLEVPTNLQGSRETIFAKVAATEIGDDGKRCVEKIDMLEKIEYDDVIECDHSYNRRCHTTYKTTYAARQEAVCGDNFLKTCFIELDPLLVTETVEVCSSELVKDCDVEGEEICKTEHVTECWTNQEEHEVYGSSC